MYVLLADDHAVVLEGLELLFSTFDFIEKTEKATDEATIHQFLSQSPLPDLILLDIELGSSDGRTLCRHIKNLHPGIKLIALTSHSDPYVVKSSIKAGFDGYLLKSEDRLTVMDALQTVSGGQSFFSPHLEHIFFRNSMAQNKYLLTKREKDVLRLILDEKTTKEIGDILFISDKTVENHRSSLMQKLEAKNMAGLVKKAITQGLVEV